MIWVIMLFVIGNALAIGSLSVGLFYQHRINRRLMTSLEIYRRWLESNTRRLEMQGERLDDHWAVIMERLPQPRLFSSNREEWP